MRCIVQAEPVKVIDESISVATQVEKTAGGGELKATDELALYVAFKTDENGDPITGEAIQKMT